MMIDVEKLDELSLGSIIITLMGGGWPRGSR